MDVFFCHNAPCSLQLTECHLGTSLTPRDDHLCWPEGFSPAVPLTAQEAVNFSEILQFGRDCPLLRPGQGRRGEAAQALPSLQLSAASLGKYWQPWEWTELQQVLFQLGRGNIAACKTREREGKNNRSPPEIRAYVKLSLLWDSLFCCWGISRLNIGDKWFTDQAD